MNPRSIRHIVIALLLASPAAVLGESGGALYVVTAIDTEPLNEIADVRSVDLDLANFDTIGAHTYIHQVMSPQFRSQYRDSYGGNIKFTFFVETSEAICSASGSDCAAVYNAMQTFRTSMEAHGDDLAWHYHHVAWRRADWGPRHHYWSQIVTFDGTEYYDGTDIEAVEGVLNCLLINHDFFPTSYRSGWAWENTDFSNWLDNVVPFDFSNLSPLGTSEAPCSTVFWDYSDWTRAPMGWTHYHPSREDYQLPGDSRRTIFRCNCSGMFASQLERAFELAATGEDVYVCAYSHSSASIVDFLQHERFNLLQVYSERFRVPFVYTTSTEAARIMLDRRDDTTTPVLTIDRTGSTLVIRSNEEIFQKFPYCVLAAGGELRRIKPVLVGKNTWETDLPDVSKFSLVVGACDLAGNSSTTRYESFDD